jgi:hypothetical protein
VVEGLPSIQEALGPVPVPLKKKKENPGNLKSLFEFQEAKKVL